MGNRANIIFDTKGSKALPSLYLHWNGGPESVYTFLAYLKSVCRDGDSEYTPARFAQIVGNYLGGNLSLGLSAVTRDEIRDASKVGDNGAYVVDAETLTVTTRWFEDYIDLPHASGTHWEEGVTFRREFRELSKKEISAEKREALAHDYNKGGKLLKAVAEVNDAFFRKEPDEEVHVSLRLRVAA